MLHAWLGCVCSPGGGGGNYFSFTINRCVHRQLMLKRVHLRESSPPRKRIRVREDRVREKISGSGLVVKGLGLDNHAYIENHDVTPDFNCNYTFRNCNSNVSNDTRDDDRGFGKIGGSTVLVDIDNHDVNHHNYLNCK